MNSKNLRSTQQSSSSVDYTPKKDICSNLESNMFLDDMCMSFSCALSKTINERNFYYIKSDCAKLKELLRFEPYEFDELLQKNMYDLLLYGEAYVEKVLWYDSKENLVRIEFKRINYNKLINFCGRLYYKLHKYNGKVERGVIDNRNLIIFKLKDLGYSKHYFRHKIKKLGKIKLPNTKLAFKKNSGYDFNIFKQKQDYKLLKIMNGLYWFGRNYSNEFISEPYILYRIMKFDMIKNEFLKYLVDGYNNALEELGNIYNFNGEIIYKTKVEKYDCLLKDFKEGKISCDGLRKEIFKI